MSYEKILRLWLAFFFVLLGTRSARAECDPDFPDRCSVPLAAGEAAPFAGQLISPSLAIALGQKAAGCDARVELETTHTASVAAARCRYALGLAEADKTALRRERDIWKAQAEDVEPSALEHPVLVAGLAVVGTIAVLFLAREIVQLDLSTDP